LGDLRLLPEVVGSTSIEKLFEEKVILRLHLCIEEENNFVLLLFYIAFEAFPNSFLITELEMLRRFHHSLTI